LFQSKFADSGVCFALNFTFSLADGSVAAIGAGSDSAQFPLTICASVQLSAWAETGSPASEMIVRRLPAMNACFGLNISVSYLNRHNLTFMQFNLSAIIIDELITIPLDAQTETNFQSLKGLPAS
jgi:hypothetical protein